MPKQDLNITVSMIETDEFRVIFKVLYIAINALLASQDSQNPNCIAKFALAEIKKELALVNIEMTEHD